MNLPAGFDPALLLLLVPLILLQLGLLIYAVVDLLREDRHVRGGSKGMWAVIIVFVNLIGPLLYLLIGRVDGPPPESSWPTPAGKPGWGSPHDAPFVPPEERPAPVVGQGPTAAAEPAAAPLPPATAPSSVRVATDAGPAIRLERLTRRYPSGVLALDALDLAIPEGGTFGLLGPNGAGKTTALRLIAGLARPTAGRAVVLGTVVDDDPLAVRRRLGYLEQDPRAYGWMTGREQLSMLGRLHGLQGARLRDAVDAALQRVGLGDAADRRTSSYSGGMRQRLGIAGALVHRPPVIVLDEPVSSLDPEGRRDVLELIASMRGQATVLFSTHVLADVERVCDRVAILDHGRLLAEDALGPLLDRYARSVYRVEAEPGHAAGLEALGEGLRSEPWVTAVGMEHGVLTVAVTEPAAAAPRLFAAIAASDVAVASVGRDRPTLEDVFLRLTGDGRAAA